AAAGAGAIGATEGESSTVAIGLGFSLAVNIDTDNVVAVVNHSTVVRGGGLQLRASARPSVPAATASGPLGRGTRESGGISFAGAAGVSINVVHNLITAQILGGSHVSLNAPTPGAVTLSAVSVPLVRAYSIVAAGVLNTGGGSPIGAGALVAGNDVENDVTANVDN